MSVIEGLRAMHARTGISSQDEPGTMEVTEDMRADRAATIQYMSFLVVQSITEGYDIETLAGDLGLLGYAVYSVALTYGLDLDALMARILDTATENMNKGVRTRIDVSGVVWGGEASP